MTLPTFRRYPVTCCKCGHKFEGRKSIFMEMGYNDGHLHCPACKTRLHVEITPDLDGDHMITELWVDYMSRYDPVVPSANISPQEGGAQP